MSTGPILAPPTIPFSTAVAALPEVNGSTLATDEDELLAQSLFDERINAVLRGAIEGLGCSAAELRLIDDAAVHIRTTHSQAIANIVFAPTARVPLADAAGELAAMSGAAVVLDDQQALSDWDLSQPVGSAVCVPVASDTTIHGALWMYREEPAETGRSALQLIEIVAGRIAVEFERHWLLEQERYRQASISQTSGRRSHRRRSQPRRSSGNQASVLGSVPASASVGNETLLHPATRQSDTANDTSPLTDCDTAGIAISEPAALHIEQRLVDGRVMLVAASVVDSPGLSPEDAAIVTGTINTALRDHMEEATDAGALLTEVGRKLWRHTTGGDAVSMAIALVDEEAGDATLALAGDAAALRVKASCRTPYATDLPPIGWDDQAVYSSTRFELAVRERIVLAIGAPRQSGAETADQMASAFKTATANDHRQMTAGEALARASAAPLAEGTPLLAASALRRR